jgi:hypothetical protein
MERTEMQMTTLVKCCGRVRLDGNARPATYAQARDAGLVPHDDEGRGVGAAATEQILVVGGDVEADDGCAQREEGPRTRHGHTHGARRQTRR